MKTEKIDGNKLMTVFEEVKMMKSEYVLIPRELMQASSVSSVLGISYNAMVYSGIFDKLKDPYFYQMWQEPTLPYIMMETKNANTFRSERNKMYGPDTPYDDIYIDYETYFINGKPVSIAHTLRDGRVTESGEYVSVTLVAPNEMLEKINLLIWQVGNAKHIITDSNITDNPDFRDIIDAKAGAGASMWIPKLPESDLKPIPYGISLNTSILNVSKGDSIYLNIYDRIPQRSGYCFVAQFTVSKVKRKARIDTYLTMMKVM